MSERLANGMFSDLPLPLFLRRRVALARQRWHFLAQDGVNKKTAPAVEALYLGVLEILEAILKQRPFLMGARPTEADYGFFGSMFRHFFCDPTPGRIMRDRAPAVLAWVTRMWNLTPADFTHEPMVNGIPLHLDGLAGLLTVDFLPYLAANAAAHAAGKGKVRFQCGGGSLEAPVNPYRAWRLQHLQDQFAAISLEARQNVAAWMGKGDNVLEAISRARVPDPIPSLPMKPAGGRGSLDRQWRRPQAVEEFFMKLKDLIN
jgi:hypothetical protein